MLVRVVLLGFGNVGRAIARMLLDKREHFASTYDLSIVVVGIATGSHGVVFCEGEHGIDLACCLAAAESVAVDGTWRLPSDAPGCKEVADAHSLLRCVQGRCDAVLESVNASHVDGEPALSFLRAALQMDPPAHAITASKPPVALAYAELSALAAATSNARRFLFESSVMDGVPIFCLLRQMPGARVLRVQGILNSTTNIILSRMGESGCSMQEALLEAQAQGIAERDPSDDIDGRDAAAKLAVISAVAFGMQVGESGVSVEGIRDVTPEQVKASLAKGHALKLVCQAALTASSPSAELDRVEASVQLQEVPKEHPLASVTGASAALTIETDVLSPITMTSTDPTTKDTAYGLVQDLLNAVLGDGQGLLRNHHAHTGA